MPLICPVNKTVSPYSCVIHNCTVTYTCTVTCNCPVTYNCPVSYICPISYNCPVTSNCPAMLYRRSVAGNASGQQRRTR